MSLYEPIQKLVISNKELISELTVGVKKGENLVLLWKKTETSFAITNIAYRIIEDLNQLGDKIFLINKIPWNEKPHKVEITIYSSNEQTSEHTSNTSDDADIKPSKD